MCARSVNRRDLVAPPELFNQILAAPIGVGIPRRNTGRMAECALGKSHRTTRNGRTRRWLRAADCGLVSRAARGMGCFCERSQHRDLASERLTIAQNFAAIIRVTAEFSKYWLRDDRAQSDKSRA